MLNKLKNMDNEELKKIIKETRPDMADQVDSFDFDKMKNAL